MKRWYIIHAYSGYEKQVMRSLNERIQRSAVADSFGEVLVPTEEVVEMKDGKNVSLNVNSFLAMCWSKWK